MRTEIQLPDGELAVGFDAAFGFFATLRCGRRRYEFDRLSGGHDPGPFVLHALLAWLVAQGVFTADDLEGALLRHADLAAGHLSRGGEIALEVIEALKRAAAD